MALDSRELMLEKFVTVNKVRYPDYKDRLDKVNVNSIEFDTIAADPASPITGRVSNLESKSLHIEAEEQSWECALMNSDRVLNFSDTTLYTSLNDIVTTKTRGFYRYKDSDNKKVAVMVIPTEYTSPSDILSVAMLEINSSSNYLIKTREVSITDIISSDIFKILVNGDTIYGELTIVRNDPNKLSAGTWVKGYYGQVLSADFISPEVLTEMVGVPKENIIYQDENLWLKFSYNGKTIYIAQKPTASNLTYDQLSALNLTEGKRLYTIKGDNYYVRVPRGIPGTEYNEWEDLFYHVSANDPDKLFWEQFTDDELGIGLSGGTTRSKGEWTWCQQENKAVASVTIRGGNNGITGNSTSLLNAKSTNRGFRPVLIMEGVNGIELDPAFVMTPPLRLIPLNHAIPGTTDAFPIKSAITQFVTAPPKFTSSAMDGTVISIREIKIRKDEDVHAPIVKDTVISDTILNIRDISFKNVNPAPVMTSTSITTEFQGIYQISAPKFVSPPPVPKASTVDYSHDTMGISMLKVVGAPRALLATGRPASITVPPTDYSELGN